MSIDNISLAQAKKFYGIKDIKFSESMMGNIMITLVYKDGKTEDYIPKW